MSSRKWSGQQRWCKSLHWGAQLAYLPQCWQKVENCTHSESPVLFRYTAVADLVHWSNFPPSIEQPFCLRNFLSLLYAVHHWSFLIDRPSTVGIFWYICLDRRRGCPGCWRCPVWRCGLSRSKWGRKAWETGNCLIRRSQHQKPVRSIHQPVFPS